MALADDALPGFRLQAGNGASMEGRFADRHAGTGKSIAYAGPGAAFEVATSGGRPVHGARLAYTADILPRTVSRASLVAADKVHDATRTALLSGPLAGIVAGDQVELAGATGLFDTRNAGAGKLVTITGGVLAGLDAANYVLDEASTTRATIIHRPLDIAIGGAVRKEYDGGTGAGLAGAQFILAGAMPGDELAVRGPGQGSYDSPDPGQEKQVSVLGNFEISGADAPNYRVGSTPLAGTVNLVAASASGKVGSIAPAPLPPVQEPPPLSPQPQPQPQPPAPPLAQPPVPDSRTAALNAAVRSAIGTVSPAGGGRGLLDRSASCRCRAGSRAARSSPMSRRGSGRNSRSRRHTVR